MVMATITRDTELAQSKEYDLVIIGGGIYGAMLCLEAVANGLKPLLLEKSDFGGATSFNSLRILHGGLRYLQSMDLPRFYESVSERRWFLQQFPQLAKPLTCMMPLYGDGMRKPSIFRVALALNDILSFRRNNKLLPISCLPNGKIINTSQVLKNFPMVDQQGLMAGALWYDGAIADSQRVIMEILRWANHLGATTLNYVNVTELSIAADQVEGVAAIDQVSKKVMKFTAPLVINATGAWSRDIARKFDKDYERLFRCSIAWNVLFDRPALSEEALAITPKQEGGQTYFIHPWKNRLLIGTGHAPWQGGTEALLPEHELIQTFISDINTAIPDLRLQTKDIVRIFSGLLPSADQACTRLASREEIVQHDLHGGPRGFVSVSGVKFTTSRLVAQKTLSTIYPDRGAFNLATSVKALSRPEPQLGWDTEQQLRDDPSRWIEKLRHIIADESVIHLDDLIVRRTTLWENPTWIDKVTQNLDQLFSWDEPRQRVEIDRCKNLY